MAESTVVVLVFEDEKDGERLFDTLQQRMAVESFPVNNAAVAIYRQDGEVTVRQMIHQISENGFSPRDWEFLIKTVLSGWGHHIDDWSIEKFQQVFHPGTSAFFSLLEPRANREILLKLGQFNGTLIYAGFTEAQKAALKAEATRSS